jgi:hypothetical protein
MISAALIICLALLSGPVVAGERALRQSWSRPENLSSSPTHSRYTELAHDPTSGDLMVVWEEGAFPEEEILGRRWVKANNAWTPIQNFSSSPWMDKAPALLFDAAGDGHLLWTRRYAAFLGAPEDGTDLIWRRWDGAAWSEEEVLLHVDSALSGSYGVVLSETPDSVLLLVVWNGGYRQAEYREGAWSELTPWDYSLGVMLAQVIVDGNGLWHAAGYGLNDNEEEPWFYDAYYVNYDGANWTAPLNLSLEYGVAKDVGLALDGQGRLHFLWSDSKWSSSSDSQKSAIWERIYTGSGWTPNAEVTQFNENQAINGFDVTTDLTGTLHLAWSEGLIVNGAHTGLDIYYQSGDGTAWGQEDLVYRSSSSSQHPAMALSDQDPAIVWQEAFSAGEDVLFSRQAEPDGTTYEAYLPLVSR